MALKDQQTQIITQGANSPPAPVLGPFVVAQGSIKIIDIVNPAAPVLASTTLTTGSTVNDCYTIDSSRRIYYFSRKTPDTNSRLEIFDASNPYAVTQLANILTPSSNDGYRCVVVGTILWVIVDSTSTTTVPNTLRAFDISTPTAPVLIATYDMIAGFGVPQQDPNGIRAFGSLLYITNNSLLGDEQFGIYNATNPLAVTQVSVTNMVFNGGPLAIALNFPLAYIYQSSPTSLLSVFDVTNPAVPLLVGSVGGFGNAIPMSYAPDNNLLYMVAFSPVDKGIRICDVSVPTAPVLVGSPLPGGTVNRNRQIIAKNGKVVNICNGTAGGNMTVQVYDGSLASTGVLTFLGEVIYAVPTVGPNGPYIMN